MSFAVAGLFFFLIMAFLGWMYQHMGLLVLMIMCVLGMIAYIIHQSNRPQERYN